MPAGEPRADGTYPDGTVNALVDRKLNALTKSIRGFYAGRPGGLETQSLKESVDGHEPLVHGSTPKPRPSRA